MTWDQQKDDKEINRTERIRPTNICKFGYITGGIVDLWGNNDAGISIWETTTATTEKSPNYLITYPKTQLQLR